MGDGRCGHHSRNPTQAVPGRHLRPRGLQTSPPPFQPGPAEASLMVWSSSLPALLLLPKFLARRVKKS